MFIHRAGQILLQGAKVHLHAARDILPSCYPNRPTNASDSSAVMARSIQKKMGMLQVSSPPSPGQRKRLKAPPTMSVCESRGHRGLYMSSIKVSHTAGSTPELSG